MVSSVADFNDTSAEIGHPSTSNGSLVSKEIDSSHVNSSDSSDLEHANEEQNSKDIGESISDQDSSPFGENDETEIPTITEQPDSSVVVTKPVHGSGKEESCPKATLQVRHHDFHRQELKLLNKRLDNLTLLLESNRNFGQSVSIVVKNYVFPTIIFWAILLADLLFGVPWICSCRNWHHSWHVSNTVLLNFRSFLLHQAKETRQLTNDQ